MTLKHSLRQTTFVAAGNSRRAFRGRHQFLNLNRRESMADGKVTWQRWDERESEVVTEAIERRIINGDRMMLAHVYLRKGAIVPQHSHENEQFTYILEGALRFWLGEDGSDVRDVRAGEVLHIPSNVL